MLFMLIVKASKNSEAGNLPSPELRQAMTQYNEELVKAGVRVAAKDFIQAQTGFAFRIRQQGRPGNYRRPLHGIGRLDCRVHSD